MTEQALNIIVPVSEGKLVPSDAQKAVISAYLRRGQHAVSVRLAPPRKPRSLKANAYLWGVVYQSIADHTGMSTEDVHDYCRDEFLPRRFVTLGGKEKELRKSTAELDQRSFNEYIEKVCAFASQELGIMIPLPSGRGAGHV